MIHQTPCTRSASTSIFRLAILSATPQRVWDHPRAREIFAESNWFNDDDGCVRMIALDAGQRLMAEVRRVMQAHHPEILFEEADQAVQAAPVVHSVPTAPHERMPEPNPTHALNHTRASEPNHLVSAARASEQQKADHPHDDASTQMLGTLVEMGFLDIEYV
jgi:hypothetical protein